MTKKEQILKLLRDNPEMPYGEIAEVLGVSRQYVYAIVTDNKHLCRSEAVVRLKTEEVILRKKARAKYRKAILLGELTPQPCEVCGKFEVEESSFSYPFNGGQIQKRTRLKVDGHHDDYNKPLDVRWLCPEHHGQWHAQNKPKGILDNPYEIAVLAKQRGVELTAEEILQ